MKKNGKPPKNIHTARILAEARKHGQNIKLNQGILKHGLSRAIQNAKAAQACVAACNVPAAAKCIEQLLLESGAAKNWLDRLGHLVDSHDNAG